MEAANLGSVAKGKVGLGKGTQWDPRACPIPGADPALCACAWTRRSRGKVLITQLLISDISVGCAVWKGQDNKTS